MSSEPGDGTSPKALTVKTPESSSKSSQSAPRNGPHVRFGITEPISLQEPSDNDLALTKRMMEELQVAFPAETSAGMAHRQSVLQELEKIVKDWMTRIGIENGLTEEDAKHNTAKITTLGSYRLGVVHPGSDIDTLCIGPPHVSRDDFFSSFVDQLRRHEDLTECVPVPDAYTPIIKLKMRNVYIDLLFAGLVRPLINGESPEDVAKDDDVLRNMDEKSVRCMNGFRVADQILSLVPNQETFRRTLRFIKFWARQRGIYSNVLGFFGGITWSLLVARVCQLYPHNAPNQLVKRFFRLYHQWNWTKPVMLCDIVDPMNVPGMSGYKVWNPKVNLSDRAHLMPVITPAFPSMNSTHNVTETTKRILIEEFKRGYEVTMKVEAAKAEWMEVTAAFPFFAQFSSFLWIEILSKQDEVFKKFSGYVESKLRILTQHLEGVTGMIIHPNPVQYDLHGSDKEWPFGCGMFIAIMFSKEDGATPGQTVDLRPAMTPFLDVISQWSDRRAYGDQYLLRVKRIRSKDLPDYATAPEVAKKRKSSAAAAASNGNTAAKKARLG